MPNFLRSLAVLFFVFLTATSFAQEVLKENQSTNQLAPPVSNEPTLNKPTPEVGKHVMANTDVGSMILSLLMVLALIFVSALVLKRFKFAQQNTGQMQVLASLSLGVKERLVVVKIGEEQLVLGVTSEKITLIKSLEEPITSEQPEHSSALTGNVLAFLQKNNFNKKDK